MTTDLLASATPTITYAPPEGVFTYIWVLIALPLIGAAVLLSFGRRTDSWGHYLATALPIGSFILAIMMWLGLLARPSEDRGIIQHLWDWVFVGNFTANVGLQIDQLSLTFVLLITGVGSLIHIYSIGYMKDDPKRRLFFAYLNLFVAAMLLLVLADNYLLLYVGWEGVGLASYLLIGFWQYKPSAAVAAKKAFVVNRVGDFGLSVAIMAIFVSFGTVTFPEVFAQAGESSEGTLTWIGLLLLLAACGKSAQFPLQSWLLDAMEGPTPVSALIHAATMVTAGVYLIARSNPIFDGAPTAQTVVIAIGAITLIFGAIIGLAKDEIKKVLAGSTMSQIGYMVLAAGLGPIGYVFAIFHLVNHGFFKANMFLGAGSVMHSFNNQENMRRFGGIRTVMVVTYITFAAGWLAIMGVPPFSGFYSKDKIIEAAFDHSWAAGLAAMIGAGITAFYMTRLFTMTFLGKKRWTDDVHPHESPPVMTIPLILLGIASLASGFLLAWNGAIEKWLEPVVGFQHPEPPIPIPVISGATLALVILGAVLAYQQYRREVPLTAPTSVSPLTVAARKDLYGDAFNEAVFMRPGQYLTRALVWFDNRSIDGAVVAMGSATAGLSNRLRKWQTGYSRSYALSMLAGAFLLFVALLVVRL
ncbi:MAG: NADH-quinone oxidoreductase subunit L [Actinobacteria bacterium]|jgi:NADH-quinone oxidoreductase subunit L|nr:NADH-quinone oxidoreductase subunit L [Micrococcales bacterium]MCB9427475.1 NADH-quinone oxidoreductase subunit L [Actinomycetota bacterium]HPE11457.1 NADH-quinone oxidoreductase subunit L [Actinomycetota bacterium]HRV65384.1 NADH-quinone oxidoreductase subunit L [Candidatus Nanopelagicales bacterium]